jgi:hypothetical protein
MFNLTKIAHRLPLLLLLAGGLLLPSACENKDIMPEDDDTYDGDDVEFTLDLNVGKEVSRADVGSGDIFSELGTAEENYIDPNKVRIYIYSSSKETAWKTDWGGSLGGSTPESATYPTEIRSIQRIDNSNTYRVRFTIPSLPTTTYFRVAVTANWPYTPIKMDNIAWLTIQPGAEYQYHYGGKSATTGYYNTGSGDYTASDSVDYRTVNEKGDSVLSYYYPSEETPMPMYGCRRFTTANFKGHKEINLPTITLIRAMAKIVVRGRNLGDDIESATLAYSYDVGLCGTCIFEDTGTETINTSEGDHLAIPRHFSPGTYSKGLNDQNPLRRIENIPFFSVSATASNNIKVEQRAFILYIPSYNNVTVGKINALPTYIKLKMKKHPEVDYTIEFKNDDGSYYNLCRNYMYVYDVYYDYDHLWYNVTDFEDYNALPIEFD